MLVLSRRRGESIYISGPCELKILRAERGYARIGFRADDHVKILRMELVNKNNDTPSQQTTPDLPAGEQ